MAVKWRRPEVRAVSLCAGLFVLAFGVMAGPLAPGARGAETGRPIVHPIYAHVQDAPQNDLAVQRFSLSTRRFGLGPVEIVDIEGDPLPRTSEKLRAGIDLVRKLDFASAQTVLDQAASEVAATGGAGLDAAGLSDLFLYRAWAVSRADFNKEHGPSPQARAQAYPDVLRAVMLTPARQFNRQQYPPTLLEDWTSAVADAAARPQSTVLVRAAPEASVSCDGGPAVPGPATFVGLTQGEHVIHVDEPGWAAWGATFSANAPSVEIELPPRRALTLDDAAASAHARRMGAKFALVAEPRPGQAGGLSLSLRLVDVNGVRKDAAIEPLAGDPGALDAAVMRLDEQARRMDALATKSGTTGIAGVPPAMTNADPLASLAAPVLVSSPPPRPRLADDPGAWAREHWPLLTAVGAIVGATVVLSISVAQSR